jgi:hypothetical protein
VGDFRIYEAYQKGGYNQEAAKKLVRSVLDDSTPYEIAKR